MVAGDTLLEKLQPMGKKIRESDVGVLMSPGRDVTLLRKVWAIDIRSVRKRGTTYMSETTPSSLDFYVLHRIDTWLAPSRRPDFLKAAEWAMTLMTLRYLCTL